MGVLERVEELRLAQWAAQQAEMENRKRVEEERQRELEETRRKNLAAFERFLKETQIREKLEELQKAEKPEGKVLVRSLNEDNSRIELSLRWVSEWIPEEKTKLYGITQEKVPIEYQFVSIEWSNDDRVLVRGAQIEQGWVGRETDGRLLFDEMISMVIARAYLNPGRETDLTVMYQASEI